MIYLFGQPFLACLMQTLTLILDDELFTSLPQRSVAGLSIQKISLDAVFFVSKIVRDRRLHGLNKFRWLNHEIFGRREQRYDSELIRGTLSRTLNC